MIMKYPALKPACNVRWTLAGFGLALVSLLLIFQLLPDGFNTKSFHISSPKDSEQSTLKNTEGSCKGSATIPNIVHFVHLVKPSPNPTFEFPFRQFIAIYSAWYYLQPETINIYTNVDEHLIEETIKRSTSPWTKAVSKLPKVKVSHQTPPDHTTSGEAIPKLPNQSDFVRTGILREFGGIYLDEDAYVLRDLAPLRRMGFQNVVGYQLNGQICPAVILSTPGNKLMEWYHALQHKAINPNRWALHATDLLSTLAMDFQEPSDQVLVLPHNTFFPYDWRGNDLKPIYQVHDKDLDAPDAVTNKGTQNLTEYSENFHLYGPEAPESWKTDLRSSYVLHGWTSGIETEFNDQERDAMFRKFGGITPDFVLAQSSNFARAVYPAFKHALDNGVLDGIEYNKSQP